MLERLRDLFERFGETSRGGDDDGDPRVAAAALLFHLANADGAVSAEEEARIVAALGRTYGVDEQEARTLAERGRLADLDSVDLFGFTRVIIAHADEAERVRFVQLLWDITLADGDVHELEDNLVWRIAELLGVSARDRMLGKRQAIAREPAS